MATTRISALTELTTPASADVLVINDDSAGSTKKIQLSNLIPDDAIDSEHYVAGSIDNEHLADDAVDSDELASGAVDIDHLSATGTASSSTFLRGDNSWVTPTDTNTMGSGFTVSATTDSNATTITQGDDLMFTAGTGITTETTADGTVTIASTVTDTNTMGSGFTVSATTDSNATTITQGDDLMFTAGTGITCETTADGTVTITNTISGASTATSSATGLIKIEDDTDQSVAAEAVSTTANRTYGLQLNSSDQGVVNVPWTDTNTTYSAGDFKLDDLDSPDDNTDLDFSTSAHGLVPKCTDTGNFLKGDGTWAAAGGGFNSVQTFTSSTTWSRPSGVTKVNVFVVGGGGGGGGANTAYGGACGGGGGTSIKYGLDVSGISSSTITIGAAGSAGGAPSAGGAGGASSWDDTTNTYTGNGGGGGGSNAGDVTGGSGGTASGGTLNVTGQAGVGTWNHPTSGGSPLLFGLGGAKKNPGNGSTNPGTGYGAGGGGGISNAAHAVGTAGTAGIVVVEEYK